jgi:hypothetical protein
VLDSDFQGIARAQDNGINHGPQDFLDNAVAVFDESVGDIVGGSTCFWTPTLANWSNVQTALSNQTTTFPSGTGAPGCFASSTRQIVVKANFQEHHQRASPVFLFIRERGTGDPAVVQIN